VRGEATDQAGSRLERARRGVVRTYRVANPASSTRLLRRTGVQVVVVWGVALGALPAIAVQVDRRLGLPRLRTRGQRPLGIALFAAGSAVGLSSAWFMATAGRGTPIPFDAARELVVVGPYRVVRNPMAVSAIVQSAGIALALGSPTAALIPPAGALVWNQVIRPTEEDFLRDRFGDRYRRYQAAVRCWVPTLRPYVDDDPGGSAAVTASQG
jgi:protein-S-isoprenylcysteine O-methyltransferase Ste14